MARITFAQAFADAVYLSFSNDPNVLLIWGSFFGLSQYRSLSDRFRKEFPDRVAFTPTSELGNCGIAIGAAIAGARPIVPVGAASFIFRAWDQIQHEAAVARYMSNGMIKAPVVFHMLHGIRGGGGPQHSQSPQAMLWNCPGLELVMPSTPYDVKGLFRAAIQSDNPTAFLVHPKLLDVEGEVPDEDYAIPLGKADIKRDGKDVSLVATSLQVHTAMAAAADLQAMGVSAEVLDLRTLRPLDRDALAATARKTGRVVAIDDCPPHCSTASEIAAIVSEECFRELKAPVERVTRMDAPIPFSPLLEDYVSPTVDKVVAAAQRALAYPKSAGD
ncbi:MAG TPA: transketolase C-terminal domain-containing protein [Alphaproteobacteria bacterium]|jgi:pyruvate dehydrogenase E1 component beta subunit